MKKRISLLLALVLMLSAVLFTLPSCGSGADSPEDAATTYVEAMLSCDFDNLTDIVVGSTTKKLAENYMIGVLDQVKAEESYSYTIALENRFGTSNSSSLLREATKIYQEQYSILSEIYTEGYTYEIATIVGSSYQGQSALDYINDYNEEVADFVDAAMDDDAPAGALEIASAMVCKVPTDPYVTQVTVKLLIKDSFGDIEETESIKIYTVKDGSSWKVLDQNCAVIDLANAISRVVYQEIDY